MIHSGVLGFMGLYMGIYGYTIHFSLGTEAMYRPMCIGGTFELCFGKSEFLHAYLYVYF